MQIHFPYLVILLANTARLGEYDWKFKRDKKGNKTKEKMKSKKKQKSGLKYKIKKIRLIY
jgi:hypothetical protein